MHINTKLLLPLYCFLDTLHHVVSDDILASKPHPPFPASIMDGYAVIGIVSSVFALFTQI